MSERMSLERSIEVLHDARDKELLSLGASASFNNLSHREYEETREFIIKYFAEWEMNLIAHYNQSEVE